MSDEEDNEQLLSELQILKYALDRKAHTEIDHISSHTTEILLKVEKNLTLEESELNSVESGDEDENGEFEHEGDTTENEGSDSYEKFSCKDLQDLFELNKKLHQDLINAQNKMQERLTECLNNQRIIEEKLLKHSSSYKTKIVNFNAGMPYFKDKNYFTAPRNEDTETKIKNGELRLAQLQRINRWSQTDKTNLLKTIRYEVTLTLSDKNEPDEAYLDNSIKKTSQLPRDIKKVIRDLGTEKFDWLKIAANIPDNKHSAEECEVMWKVFLHPDINKQKWTSKEERELNKLVEELNFEDWDAIALQLNTNRSGYQCFIRYNTNNWKNLMKGQNWKPVDDRTLTYLVNKLKIGDFIPWGYIASSMNDWTKQQVYYRWNYSLAPHLKKGRFSEAEDKMLLEGVAKYGLNFSKIAGLLMTNRTHIQLKDRYQTLEMKKHNPKRKHWSLEDDGNIIRFQEKYGSDWAKIAKEMIGTTGTPVTRIQVRQRWNQIKRYAQRGIALNKICRKDEDQNLPLDNSTTLTYTTDNSPWSRENREILVRHLKIDNQLINFFKKEDETKKGKNKCKAYSLDKLKQDTKKFYDTLVKLNVKIDVPDYIDDNNYLSESYMHLLASLKTYAEKCKCNEKAELVRLQMYGPQEPIPEKLRFVPPLPFSCRSTRKKCKVTKTIDFPLDTNKFHIEEIDMEFEPQKEVHNYLSEDVVLQFEKFKTLLVTKIPTKSYSLKCKPFADSNLFGESSKKNNVGGMPMFQLATNESQMEYNWALNKMVNVGANESEKELNLTNLPISIFPANRTTLQAHQELLMASSSTSSSILYNSNTDEQKYGLTPRGREALYTFKRRYQQLFEMPTTLSRIVPPDVVDESLFLPYIERFRKAKKIKRRR